MVMVPAPWENRSRSGFTLIELVVVIGVVLIVSGLTLPAVQAAREAARRAQCQARMAEVGQAIHAHVAAHGTYPTLTGMDPKEPPPPVGTGDSRWFGPLPRLLPYLDQQALYASINFDLPLVHKQRPEPENATAGRAVLAVFLCPSDPAGSRGPWGPTNLRTCMGVTRFRERYGIRMTLGEDQGAFIWNYVPILQPRTLTPADFRDGLSGTAFVSEKIRGTGGNRFDPEADFWIVPTSRTAGSLGDMVDDCSSLRGEPERFIDRTGDSWMLPTQRYSSYNHNLPPNSPVTDCSGWWDDIEFAGTACITARSDHPGGVNVLYGDGRVAWAPSGTDVAIWRAAGTRDGGEVVSTEARP